MALRRMTTSNAGYVRLRTMLANAIVCELMPKGVVKGGSALKFRFGDYATRVTTDLDVARSTSLDAFIGAFEESLGTGWNGFTARLVAREPASPEGIPTSYVMLPYDVKLDYLGSAWCTVPFELGHDEIGDADTPDLIEPKEANEILETLGFPQVAPLPIMPLDHQIAQKLHAASEPHSNRAHDLIDLQLIVANGTVDYKKTLDTCERLFAYRKAQAWPPILEAHEFWPQIYREQAAGLAVLQNIDSAIAWGNAFIQRLCNSR